MSVAWRVGAVEEMSFEKVLKVSKMPARITDGSRYIVPGSRCRDYK